MSEFGLIRSGFKGNSIVPADSCENSPEAAGFIGEESDRKGRFRPDGNE